MLQRACINTLELARARCRRTTIDLTGAVKGIELERRRHADLFNTLFKCKIDACMAHMGALSHAARLP